nr:hypothetical protein [Tanacetum cinerariifolium]
LEDCLKLKNVIAYHLKISAITPLAWKVNRRSRKLLEVIEKLKGEADVMRARELAREEEYEGLRAMCEASMTDFDKNTPVDTQESEMAGLSGKPFGFRVKGRLVRKLVSLAITFGRCRAYEQVARMKEPFNLSKVNGYRLSYEKENTQANNDLATATFSWLNEYVADASAFVKALLSKKPPILQKLVPSRTQMTVPSSQLAIPSFALASNPMSPPADIVKPSSSPNE